MYNFKAINMTIPDKIFNEICFLSVSDAKLKLNKGNPSYIPVDIKNGIFCCNGTSNENLEIAISLENYLKNKDYIKGRDYTINILIEN